MATTDFSRCLGFTLQYQHQASVGISSHKAGQNISAVSTKHSNGEVSLSAAVVNQQLIIYMGQEFCSTETQQMFNEEAEMFAKF